MAKMVVDSFGFAFMAGIAFGIGFCSVVMGVVGLEFIWRVIRARKIAKGAQKMLVELMDIVKAKDQSVGGPN